MDFRVETVRNNYNAILNLALEIVKSEDTPDMNLLKKLNWIKDHTSKNLNVNYFLIVQTIARKLAYPLTTPIEIRVYPRKTKEFELGELTAEIEEAHIRINEIVRDVAKKYSIDISFSKAGEINLPIMPKEME